MLSLEKCLQKEATCPFLCYQHTAPSTELTAPAPKHSFLSPPVTDDTHIMYKVLHMKHLVHYFCSVTKFLSFKVNSPQIRSIPVPVSTQYLLALLSLLAYASKYKLDNKPKVYWANPKWRRQLHCGSHYYPIEWNQERGAKPQALWAHLSTHPVGIPNHLNGQAGRTRWDMACFHTASVLVSTAWPQHERMESIPVSSNRLRLEKLIHPTLVCDSITFPAKLDLVQQKLEGTSQKK